MLRRAAVVAAGAREIGEVLARHGSRSFLACVCVTCLGKSQRGQRRQVLPLREARAPVILASATWSTAGQPLAATPPTSVPSAPPNTQEMRDARLSRFG